MALTKREETGKCELVGKWKHIQVRIDTVIEEDGIEISRKYWRRAYTPSDDMSDACEEVNEQGQYILKLEKQIEELKDGNTKSEK